MLAGIRFKLRKADPKIRLSVDDTNNHDVLLGVPVAFLCLVAICVPLKELDTLLQPAHLSCRQPMFQRPV